MWLENAHKGGGGFFRGMSDSAPAVITCSPARFININVRHIIDHFNWLFMLRIILQFIDISAAVPPRA